MVVDRSHLEYTLVRHLEVAHLDHVAHRLDDEQAAKDDGKHFGVRGDGQCREQAAQCQGPGVAHEDRRGIRVVPQESKAGHRGAYRDDGQIKRIGNGIGESAMIGSLQMVAFPEGDDGEADEGDHGRACSKTIQPIRKINSIHSTDHSKEKNRRIRN